MNLLIYIFAAVYALALILIRIGLSRPARKITNIKPHVSVIIAARNEEHNIKACIHALIKQTYPKQRIEIIVINDRSTDNTADIVQSESEKDKRIHLISIDAPQSRMAPKKWALHQGIQQATGEILFFTDADCTPESNWIQGLIRYFSPEVGLVAGYSPLIIMESDTIFHRLTALDALALAGVAAGSFGLGLPLTCSGRSLAYRKSLYSEVAGFSDIGHFISGDDDLFLHLVRRRTRWKMRYCTGSDTRVPTSPPRSLFQFIAQRTRHASKGFHYPVGLIIGLIGVYLFNAALLIGMFFPSLYLTLLFAFLIKVFFEFLLIEKMARIFNQREVLKVFPAAMFLHIPYVVLFGLWGQIGKFYWKDTQFSKKMNHA